MLLDRILVGVTEVQSGIQAYVDVIISILRDAHQNAGSIINSNCYGRIYARHLAFPTSNGASTPGSMPFEAEIQQ
jgi:hypothetical protein